MSTPKHTPGPWVKDFHGSRGHIKSVAPHPKGFTPTVCRYDTCAKSLTPDEIEANGELLAAAPELAECLRDIIAPTLTAYPNIQNYAYTPMQKKIARAAALLERLGM